MKKTALALAAMMTLSSTAAVAQVPSGPVASVAGVPAAGFIGAFVLVLGSVIVSNSTTGTN